ncbi:DUF2336 domain-containing protein [Phreatobacter aquaticus]|uniref:DUF2336 domain-containing protein n=1 Tax=Phreatobacter aquaticus TaxID=2570229 RepID=A0A4D7QN76_9HYPH|nr:DUF2336 domain-containing protein [Phreatobacter aquaticus]QCK87069.1 DUF2336 domain-containing protein [Phreatobacter aquaticus]
MIVRHFLRWIQTAPAGDRADATSALARAFLHSDLSGDDAAATEAAMIVLLDDPSPLVRRALADALATSEEAPHTVLAGLLQDQPEIASIVARYSPLLMDAELVDLVGAGEPLVQYAIARRAHVPPPVAAALAEVGCLEACLAVVSLDSVEVPAFSVDRIVERFGDHADIREALFAREDLSPGARQALVVKLSKALSSFVAGRAWLGADRAERIVKEAAEKATVAIACGAEHDLSPLVRHLRKSGQLTTGLVLRALLSGHVRLFEEALGELSGFGVRRASGLIHDRRGAGFRALYDQAKLPAAAYPAFRAALDAWHADGGFSLRGGDSQLRRRMVERVLTAYAPLAEGDLDQLLALLRRFAAEAARDEARAFTRDLIAGNDAVDDEDLAFPLVAAA